MRAVERTMAILAAIVLVVAIVIGGWKFHWWFNQTVQQKQQDINAHVIRHGYEVQSDLRVKLVKDLQDISDINVQLADPSIAPAQKVQIQAQKDAVVRTFCTDGSQITSWDGVDQTIITAYNTDCTSKLGG